VALHKNYQFFQLFKWAFYDATADRKKYDTWQISKKGIQSSPCPRYKILGRDDMGISHGS